MARLVMGLVLMVFWGLLVSAAPGEQLTNKATTLQRIRRGFGNSGGGYNSGSGYGRGSDERDASVSGENGYGCSGEDGKGGSGSRELAYSRDGRSSSKYPQGRSFSKSSASASAGSYSSSQTQKNNVVV